MGDVTTGCQNDIERASAMARSMVTKYGMSETLGPIQFGEDNEEIFIGRDWGHTRNYSEDVATKIDGEIKRIVDTSYQLAKDIINDNLDVLESAADLLIEQEKISGDEFRALFPEGRLKEKNIASTDKSVKTFLETPETQKDSKDDSDANEGNEI